MGDDEKKNCPDSCVSAGIMLARQAWDNPALTIMLWADNVRGLVRPEDLKVPHSELAMHIEAAGSDVIAWMLGENSSHVVYKGKDGCCGYASGADTELLTPALVQKTREMFPMARATLVGILPGGDQVQLPTGVEWSAEDVLKREG
jgi:hypothetical protein